MVQKPYKRIVPSLYAATDGSPPLDVSIGKLVANFTTWKPAAKNADSPCTTLYPKLVQAEWGANASFLRLDCYSDLPTEHTHPDWIALATWDPVIGTSRHTISGTNGVHGSGIARNHYDGGIVIDYDLTQPFCMPRQLRETFSRRVDNEITHCLYTARAEDWRLLVKQDWVGQTT